MGGKGDKKKRKSVHSYRRIDRRSKLRAITGGNNGAGVEGLGEGIVETEKSVLVKFRSF